MWLTMGVEERIPPNSKGYCSVANFLSQKDEQWVAEFEETLAIDSASSASLHRFFCNNQAFFPGLTAFKTHRNKWCSCGNKG